MYSIEKRKPVKHIKLILIWTTYSFPFDYIKLHQTFGEYGCKPDNCIVMSSQHMLSNDFSKFDAVFFDVRWIYNLEFKPLLKRYPHQKYVALATEPFYKYRYPNLLEPEYDEFFNWTATYRLDSDIPYPFIAIKDKEGNVVGPKIEMHWEKNMIDTLDEGFVSRLRTKTKAAAWFVGNCVSPTKREIYIYELDSALSRYNLGVDVYGGCSKLKCPTEKYVNVESYLECDRMVGRDYFFYLAFENSLSEDYVTEKVLRAVLNDVVPIVHGGANYSRFLPPDSYLDARKHTPEELSFIMKELILHPSLYRRFFKWKSYYSYHDAMKNLNICAICAALNNKTKFETKSQYKNISVWLNR